MYADVEARGLARVDLMRAESWSSKVAQRRGSEALIAKKTTKVAFSAIGKAAVYTSVPSSTSTIWSSSFSLSISSA